MKQIMFIAFIVAILFLSGCDQTTTTEEGSTTSFIGGIGALSMSFVDSAPPSEVLDGKRFPFDVNLELKNEGEYDVAAGDIRLEISGINPADFGKVSSDLVKTSMSTDLYSKQKTSEGVVIDGGMTYVNFPGFNYQTELNGNVNFPLTATACYRYSTLAVTKMCVRKNLLKATVDAGTGCVVKGDKAVQNSAAPVHITSLQQFPTGDKKIAFTFVIEKVGDGNIYKSVTSSSPVCTEGDSSIVNKVYVTINTGLTGTGVALTCDAFEDSNGNPSGSNAGYVTLYSGKRTVTCTQTLAETLDFEKVVDFKIDYLYEQSVSKTILVKHPLG